MKKLLFIALFSIGLFTVSNAQMFYTITNNAPFNVDFKMADSGPINGVYHPFIAGGGGVQTGSFGSPIVFPLQFGSNILGIFPCSAFQSVAVSPSANITGFSCVAANTMSYTIAPFGFFQILNVTIN